MGPGLRQDLLRMCMGKTIQELLSIGLYTMRKRGQQPTIGKSSTLLGKPTKAGHLKAVLKVNDVYYLHCLLVSSIVHVYLKCNTFVSRSSPVFAASTVTTVVSASAVAEYLALVELHRGSGDGDAVAWVSMTETGGGLPPCKSLCTSNGATSGVPFTGKFTFYTQDSQPPQVPAALTPPGTFVQTVFLKGKMMYRFQVGKWVYIGFFANITDVAGGNYLGKCGTTSGGSLKFLFRSPNGFSITGQKSSSLTMSPESCPWQMVKITAHTGNG
jgi:hypothetical protein